jgi:Zn-dependent protease with chaperone function
LKGSWGSITYGIPALAKQIAYQLPVFVSGELGSGLDVLDKTLFSPSELPQSRKDEVKSVLELFLVDHKNLQPTLHFRSGMKANAFALPNGDIVFTDDLVELVKEDEELVAILFHELGHLQYKHITRRALQNSMVALLTIFIMGDVDVPIDLLAVPTVILDLSYSRAFESEADLYALDELNKSGIDLDNFANVMVRLNKYYNDGKGDHFARPINDTPSFLQTHPTTEDRVSLVQQYKASHNLD